MTTVAIELAQQNLSQLIADVSLGEHVVITRNNVPVAELIPVSQSNVKPTFGSAKGLIQMAPEFDAPIEDLREYSE